MKILFLFHGDGKKISLDLGNTFKQKTNKHNFSKRKNNAEVDSILKEWQFNARKKPLVAKQKYYFGNKQLKTDQIRQKKQVPLNS